MKFFLITTQYPPFYGGGIATYCKNTAEMFSAKGHDVVVVVPDDVRTGFKTYLGQS